MTPFTGYVCRSAPVRWPSQLSFTTGAATVAALDSTADLHGQGSVVSGAQAPLLALPPNSCSYFGVLLNGRVEEVDDHVAHHLALRANALLPSAVKASLFVGEILADDEGNPLVLPDTALADTAFAHYTLEWTELYPLSDHSFALRGGGAPWVAGLAFFNTTKLAQTVHPVFSIQARRLQTGVRILEFR